MRKASVQVNGIKAGLFEELENGKYKFTYNIDYSADHNAEPVSLTMPLANKIYEFDNFPPFFEGLLPEGAMLQALLGKFKLDKNDYFGQLIKVGQDLVGAVTIEEIE
jgi:serine/threonine-protein kinase HipA